MATRQVFAVYAQHKSDGRLWPAGKSPYGLCAAWNHATAPYHLMTESEHKRANRYAWDAAQAWLDGYDAATRKE